MARARALALMACLCGASALAATPEGGTIDTPVSATPDVRTGMSAHGEPRWVLNLPARQLFVETQGLPVDRSHVRGRSLLLGFRVTTPQAELLFRAGYRHGLPLADAPVYDDATLVLTSGSAVSVSAGTVARLQLDLDGFREIAGSRIMRLEAVPGLRFRFGKQTPWEAGMGVLAGLSPSWEQGGFRVERFAGVVQMSGHF